MILNIFSIIRFLDNCSFIDVTNEICFLLRSNGRTFFFYLISIRSSPLALSITLKASCFLFFSKTIVIFLYLEKGKKRNGKTTQLRSQFRYSDNIRIRIAGKSTLEERKH